MARVLKGSHSFTCTPRFHPLTEWTIPAFAAYCTHTAQDSPNRLTCTVTVVSAALHHTHTHTLHTSRGLVQWADLTWLRHWPYIVIAASASMVTPDSTEYRVLLSTVVSSLFCLSLYSLYCRFVDSDVSSSLFFSWELARVVLALFSAYFLCRDTFVGLVMVFFEHQTCYSLRRFSHSWSPLPPHTGDVACAAHFYNYESIP